MKRLLFLVVAMIASLSPLMSQQNKLNGLSDIANHYISQEYRNTLDLIEIYKTRSDKEKLAVTYLKGHCYLKIKMYDLAIETFNLVLESLPENYEVLNNIGVAYYEKKDFKNALKYFNLSFISNTGFAVAQTNYNITLEQLKKDTDGIVLTPIDDNNTVLNSSGWFYYYLGNVEKAKYYFSEAIADKPKLSENYIAISYVLDDARQFDLAMKYLKVAEKIDPNNPNVQNNQGVVYYHLGDKKLAQQCFDRAIQLSPNFAEPKNNKALLFVEEASYRSAAILFEEAIVDNRYSEGLLAESLAGLAVCQYSLGDPLSSKKNKEKAILVNYKMGDRSYLVNFLQWSSKMVELWEKF